MLYHFIGFCFFIGWVFPFYGLPIYSFYQEWLAGTLVCVIFWLVILRKKSSESVPVPRAAWTVLALFGIGLLQWILGIHPFPAAIALYGVAAAVFWMAVVLGAISANQGTGLSFEGKFFITCQWIVASAVVSAFIVFVQILGWDIYVFPLIRSPDLNLNRPSANLSQPNLMTLQLVMGMIILGWMYVEKRISPALAAALTLLLASAVFFANTRAYLLMLIAAGIFSWKIESPRARIVRLWACLLLPAIFILSAPFYQEVMGWLGYAGRNSLNMVSGDGRWRIWAASLEIIQSYPLLGVGLGAYAVGFYEQAASWYGTIGATGNAHNMILQVAAECGIFAGIGVGILALSWFWKAIKLKAPSNGIVFCNAIVGVALAHSIVEFPLWFVFFLIPVGFFLGAASNPESEGVFQIKISPYAIGAGFGASLFLSVVIYLDYIKVREYFEDAVTIGNPAKIDELKKYDRPSWLAWHLAYAKFLFLSDQDVSLENIWKAGSETVPRFPFSKGLMRFSYISAATGHIDDAKMAMLVMYRMRPMAFQAFKSEVFEACPLENNAETPYCHLRAVINQLSVELK